MKLTSLALAASLLALLPLSVQAKIVRNSEKSFTVQPGGTLKVESFGGDVVVKTGAGDQVVVIAKQTIRAKDDAEADEILEKLDLAIEQQGNDILAVAKYSAKHHYRIFGAWPPVSVDFEVTVPEHFNAELRTSGGDIEIGDLAGNVSVRTSGGDIRLGRVDGGVRADTSGGNIRLKQATGPAGLDTSGGDITVDAVQNVLDASTSGGDVSATFVGGLRGDCVLSTSGGDIRAAVDANAAFDLDASTSGGRVKDRNLVITVESGRSGKSKLAGKVNGGGPRLKLRTSGGNIEIVGPATSR